MSMRDGGLLYTAVAASLLALHLPAADAPGTNGNSYPIDLPAALRLAGAQNLEVQLARQRLAEAEAERSSAQERFFPWVAPGISYHRRDGMAQAVPAGTISDTHFQSYAPGANLSAQLDLGDAIYKSLVAKQVVKASGHALETQRQETILSAAKSYFDLAKARGLVEVARAALQTSQEYEHQLHEAVGAGIAFKGDELRIQTQTKQFQIGLRQTLEQQRVSGVELARVLHLDSRVALVAEDTGLTRLRLFDPAASIDALVNQAWVSRPELKANQALLAAARQTKNGAVYGPLIPSLNGQAFGGGLGGGPDHGPGNFGPEGDYFLGLSWRIGPGGLFDSGRIRGSKAKVAAAQLEVAKEKDAISAQVVAGLARLQSWSDQIELDEGKLESATETLRVTRERKQFGVGIVLEDLQAQQDLERARADYVNALGEYNKAQYSLSRAVGSLPAEFAGSREDGASIGIALPETVRFDNFKTGAAPPGWTATMTGTGQAKWEVVGDDSAPSKPNVLKQSGVATYPICLKDDTSLQDGFVEVKFKPVSGKEDQAGGLLWRCKDKDNYYIARANALEDNVCIYHTIKGKRTEKKRAGMKVAPNEWHTLRVDFQGNHFTVALDGNKALECDDETFKNSGKVGLWTKADSTTLFDDFRYGTK